jgi:Carboxypeptidase regulatory-like domain
MSWSTLRRQTAAVLVFGLVTLTSSGLLAAGTDASLTGRVLTQNGADPRPGVVVTLVEPTSERTYRSSPTDARGAFAIDAAPAGDYALLVEAPEGAFLASSHLQLAPGVNRPVSLALKPGREGEPPAGSTPPADVKRGGPPTWAKWVIAGAIVVGAAIVVDAVTKNDEASNF